MKSLISRKQLWLLAFMILGLPIPGLAQMEKRVFSLYEARTFAAQKPAVNETIPDFPLQDLQGSVVQLSDYKDKIVVLVKGGYT